MVRAMGAAEWLAGQLDEMDAALGALVEVNSFTENRAGALAVAAQIEALFALPGLAGRRVPSVRFGDHLVFTSEGKAGVAPVALLGHLDTVFPVGTFEGYRVDGGLRRGPGVLDMKGGLVSMAWALKAVARAGGLSTVAPLRIVIVSDEELGSSEGATVIRQEISGCQAALVFESGREHDAIVTQRKGTGTAVVRAVGRSAHAGNAYWEGHSAIWALARFVDRAQQLSDAEAGVTVNVGVMSGGTSKNTVPAEARAELDFRAPTKAHAERLWTQLQQASTQHGVEGVVLTLESRPGRLPMEKLPQTDGLLRGYARCAHAHGLGAGEAARQGGGSDGNTATSMGIPTLDGLGPRGAHFHTPQEYIEAQTLVSKAQSLADFLTFGSHSGDFCRG
jgi:glutamate carboxypeptidase